MRGGTFYVPGRALRSLGIGRIRIRQRHPCTQVRLTPASAWSGAVVAMPIFYRLRNLLRVDSTEDSRRKRIQSHRLHTKGRPVRSTHFAFALIAKIRLSQASHPPLATSQVAKWRVRFDIGQDWPAAVMRERLWPPTRISRAETDILVNSKKGSVFGSLSVRADFLLVVEQERARFQGVTHAKVRKAKSSETLARYWNMCPRSSGRKALLPAEQSCLYGATQTRSRNS